ncbi:hypothetical protein AB4Z30_10695 [Paenibacillus sp. 2TAF8]|jgi:hypothetical protein
MRTVDLFQSIGVTEQVRRILAAFRPFACVSGTPSEKMRSSSSDSS